MANITIFPFRHTIMSSLNPQSPPLQRSRRHPLSRRPHSSLLRGTHFHNRSKLRHPERTERRFLVADSPRPPVTPAPAFSEAPTFTTKASCATQNAQNDDFSSQIPTGELPDSQSKQVATPRTHRTTISCRRFPPESCPTQRQSQRVRYEQGDCDECLKSIEEIDGNKMRRPK